MRVVWSFVAAATFGFAAICGAQVSGASTGSRVAWTKSVGDPPWRVSRHVDAAGKLVMCEIDRVRRDGSRLRFTATPRGNKAQLMVSFGSPKLFSNPAKIRVLYWFDKQEGRGTEVQAEVREKNLASWIEPEGPGIEDGLANAKTFIVSSFDRKTKLEFPLKDSNPAFKMMWECARTR